MSAKPNVLDRPETVERTKHFPRYRVLIHNDNKTPCDFVVAVLLRVFALQTPKAIAVMAEAHHTGVALVTVEPLEQAEFHVEQCHSLARTRKYPLALSMEPEE
jgi:ATP-dependent Clp protease adaptor protein ClpS